MKSSSRLLVGLLLLSVATRLLILAIPRVPFKVKTIDAIGDASEYDRLALNLARHHVFSRDTVPPYRPDVFRTPGYPLLLAPIYLVIRSPLLWGILLQMALSLGIVLATRGLALEMGMEHRTAGLAAALVALSPNLAFLSTKLVTETLFTLLLLLLLLLLNRYRVAGRAADLVGAGIASGLLILVRPIALYLPIALAAYLIYRWVKARRRGLWPAFIPLACASIVVTPWIVRNGAKAGRYIVSTVGEHNVYLYSAATVIAADRNITVTEARDTMLAEAWQSYPGLDSLDEASFWPALSAVAWKHLRASPLLAARIHLLGALGSFVIPMSIGPLLVHSGAGASTAGNPHVMQGVLGLLVRGKLAKAVGLTWRDRLSHLPPFAMVVLTISVLFQIVLLAGTIAGMLLRQGRGLLWLLVPIVYFTALTGPVGEARFRAPVEPLLILFAALAIDALLRPARHRAPVNTR